MFVYRFVHTMINNFLCISQLIVHGLFSVILTEDSYVVRGIPSKIDTHVLIYNCKVWCFSPLCHDLLNFFAISSLIILGLDKNGHGMSTHCIRKPLMEFCRED